jgi:hypothetical protein
LVLKAFLVLRGHKGPIVPLLVLQALQASFLALQAHKEKLDPLEFKVLKALLE